MPSWNGPKCDLADFFVEDTPDQALYASLASLDAANPIYTEAYIRAVSSLGSQPIVIGFRQLGRVLCGCPGFVRVGRLNRSLEIPSLPLVPECFWDGLLRYCRQTWISRLTIQTYGSVQAEIPSLPGELWRASRWEFCIDLMRPDLTAQFGKEHRRLAKRADERGMQLGRSRDITALEEHLRVSQFSTERRRERGEEVSDGGVNLMFALLQSGCGELFQAVESGRVLSSILVTKAEHGAYLHAAGTDSDGMKLGASHFVISKTAEILKQEGRTVFNLGGVNDLHSGLAAYKSHFGKVGNPLESAAFNLGNPLQKKLASVVHAIRTDPRSLKNVVVGSGGRWKVYSASSSLMNSAEVPPDVHIRKLSDEDLGKIPMPEWLRQEQQQRVRRLGFNGAYGVLCNQHMAHISWLIPAAREVPRTLALRADEAEITACFTLPEYRGRNLYPMAISFIAEAVKQEVRTIYMKTKFSNLTSQRGLMKAGLRPCGWVIEYDLPRFMGKHAIVVRSFRWFDKTGRPG